jgi:hypothetical protein
MSEKHINLVYADVDITYSESTNKWVFELRGRERIVDSLKLAKEAIDKPEPKGKNSFKRISAFILASKDYSATYYFEAVAITSVAEQKSYNSEVQFWIVDSNGKRSQISSKHVYQDTSENKMRMAKYIADRAGIAAQRQQLEENLKAIATVEVPDAV